MQIPFHVARRRGRSSPPHKAFRGLEELEPRLLLSLFVTLDYSLDINNFFDTQQKKDLLQFAADQIVSRFDDELRAINPGGGNTWKAIFPHPGTGAQHEIPNLQVAKDEIIIFAGGRALGGPLGLGGSGGFAVQGSTAWQQTVSGRGQAGAPNTDFGPWGGAVTFSTTANWHFGTTTDGLAGKNDFLTVAFHELIHLFGFNFAVGSFGRFVDTENLLFNGPAAIAEYDFAGSPPMADASHWANITDEGMGVLMFTTLTQGQRRMPTPLDFAALADAGWELNDGTPRLNIDDVQLVEGNAGTGDMVFTVSLNRAVDVDVTVQFATASGTATAGSDYMAAAGTLTIPAGQLSATITITIFGDEDIEPDETFFINLSDAMNASLVRAQAVGTILNDDFRPDLAITFGAIKLPGDLLVPGDKVRVRVIVNNMGNLPANGVLTLNLLAVTEEGDETPLETLAGRALSLKPGAKKAFKNKLQVPAEAPPGDYFLLARLTDVELTGPAADTNADNDEVQTDEAVGLVHQFGAVGNRTKVKFIAMDAEGGKVILSLTGPGTGELTMDVDDVDIQLTGTTASSKVTVKTTGGDFAVRDVMADGDLRSFIAKTLDLTGNMHFAGTLGALTLRHIADDHAITITGAAVPVTVRLGRVSDLILTAAGGIKSLTLTDWLDGDSEDDDAIIAPWIGKLTVRGDAAATVAGDFEADVLLGGEGAPKGMAMAKMTVAGMIRNSSIRAAASIGSFTATALRNSRVFAGVRNDLQTLPDSLDDFTLAASINLLKLTGIPADGMPNAAQSLIAARTIGQVGLGLAGDSGLAAQRITRGITFISGDPPQPHKRGPLASPGEFGEDDIVIRIL